MKYTVIQTTQTVQTFSHSTPSTWRAFTIQESKVVQPIFIVLGHYDTLSEAKVNAPKDDDFIIIKTIH